ncbi:MAG TPA: hypothetical protein VMP11_16000 [Verrucomicrobiae bacterium]|nr:hypothetical protein [Verrucomicrobiae bacterium]
MTDKPAPIGLAIVICDQIIEDKLTGKKSLIGIFNQIAAQTFPCRHPQLCVYVALTDGRGQCAARMRIIHDESDAVAAEVNGQIQFPDAHAVVELNFGLVGLTFPEPGVYAMEFYCDDTLVLERRFHVVHFKPPQGPPPSEL